MAFRCATTVLSTPLKKSTKRLIIVSKKFVSTPSGGDDISDLYCCMSWSVVARTTLHASRSTAFVL